MTRGNPSTSHSVEIRDKEIRAGGGRGFSSGGEARVCVIRVSLFFFFSFPFPSRCFVSAERMPGRTEAFPVCKQSRKRDIRVE